MKSKLFILFLTCSAFFLFSCHLGTVLRPDADSMLSTSTKRAVEQTVDARLTELAFETLAAQAGTPPDIQETALPHATGEDDGEVQTVVSPQPSATSQPCDRMSFIKDVTIPDGSKLYPATVFNKIWRLKNVGSCAWTSDYALVFRQGDSMGAVSAMPLEHSLRPGEMVDLSVSMKAPAVPGEYSGKWQMRNAGGALFGTGQTADGPIWVSITVVKYQAEMDAAYPRHFARNIGAARWESNAGVLSPNAGEDFEIGSVSYTESPVFEGGHQDDEPTIVMIPSQGAEGIISGRYPAIEIENGDHFRSIIGCMEHAKDCYARVVLNYKPESGAIKTLGSWLEAYEGEYTQIDVDLSSLDGQKVELILQVQSQGDSKDDRIFWLAPEIVNEN